MRAKTLSWKNQEAGCFGVIFDTFCIEKHSVVSLNHVDVKVPNKRWTSKNPGKLYLLCMLASVDFKIGQFLDNFQKKNLVLFNNRNVAIITTRAENNPGPSSTSSIPPPSSPVKSDSANN